MMEMKNCKTYCGFTLNGMVMGIATTLAMGVALDNWSVALALGFAMALVSSNTRQPKTCKIKRD